MDRRLAFPIAIIAAWTVVAVAAAVQALALGRLDGRVDLFGAVVGRVSIIPLWALATPLILRSGHAFPVANARRRVSPTFVALHLALGSLFIVLTNVAIRIPAAFAPVADGGGLDALVRSTMQGVAEYYPPAMVVYGVIVALGHVGFGPRSVTVAPQAPIVLEPTAPNVESVVADAPVIETAKDVAANDAHIAVRQWNRVHLVRIEDIDFVEAEDNYVVVHAASRAYKGRERISDVESQLDARRFVRIHRSTIVHVSKIREVQPLTHGDHAVILRDGKVLRVARSRRQALGEALGVQL